MIWLDFTLFVNLIELKDVHFISLVDNVRKGVKQLSKVPERR